MSETNVINTEYEVINKSSFNINFRFIDAVTSVAVAPSTVKVYVYVDQVGTTINGRDGTNSAGLTTSDTNLINFDLEPADLTIVDTTSAATRGYEIHRVLFDVQYNAGADKYLREYIVKIKYSPVTVS